MKDWLNALPSDNIVIWENIFLVVSETFTNGLKPQTQIVLDASTVGTMKNITVVEIGELIDNMSLNEYHSQSENRVVNKKQGVLGLEILVALLVRIKLLRAKLEEITKKLKHKRW